MSRKITIIKEKVVTYEDELFPGIITGIHEVGVTVKAMTTYGKFWRWSKKPRYF